MEILEKLAKVYTSRTTKDYDAMTLSELRNERANMIGLLEAVMKENSARGVVECAGAVRLPTLYDISEVEFAKRQVETEIAWRELGGEG
jgi:hypothetical protein